MVQRFYVTRRSLRVTRIAASVRTDGANQHISGRLQENLLWGLLQKSPVGTATGNLHNFGAATEKLAERHGTSCTARKVENLTYSRM
jgi:hypothetical protein